MPLSFQDGSVQIDQLRKQESLRQKKLTDNLNQLAKLERELATLQRTGQSQALINRKTAALDTLKQSRRTLLAEQKVNRDDLAAVMSEVLINRDPAESYTQLDGAIPIALFPHRLETRFIRKGAGHELLIRIYPDQIHVDSHNPALTPVEVELGKQYWSARQVDNRDEHEQAWMNLAQRLSPTRALFVADMLQPENLDSDNEELRFPTVAQRLDNTDTAPQARLLPERWVAIAHAHDPAAPSFPGILQGSSNAELFRRWGASIPDDLAVGLSFDEQVDVDDDESALPIDDALRWVVDFNEAERVGMGIRVKDADLPRGRKLADGIGFLMLMGVDWTQQPDAAAAQVHAQLSAHRYTDGLSFLRSGSYTNSTMQERSEFSSNPHDIARRSDPSSASKSPVAGSTGVRLAEALGFTEEQSLAGIHLSETQDQKTTSELIDVLWESTLGYFLDEMADPLANDRAIKTARDHARLHLQPAGHFNSLRVGKQPYGILPVITPTLFKPDKEKGLEPVLHQLLSHYRFYWEWGTPNIPFMGKSDDPDDDLLHILQHTAVSSSKRFRRAYDKETQANLEGSEDYQEIAFQINELLNLAPLAAHLGKNARSAKLADMMISPTHQPLLGPWVQAAELSVTDTLSANYIEKVLVNLDNGSQGRSALLEQAQSSILLEALLAYAALRELDRASTRAIDKHLVDTGLASSLSGKATLRTRSLTGIHAEGIVIPETTRLVETPAQQAALRIPAITGNNRVNMADFISNEMIQRDRLDRVTLGSLPRFRRTLKALAGKPSQQLDHAFRGIVDAYSHRLDAWLSSLASRRLQALRKQQATGVHIGGFAWVHDLKPDAVDSLGYVHAPSLDHAATAAILRSAHLSHRGAHQNRVAVDQGSDESVFNIDLSSRRVRTALTLIDGVSQGQSLAALLGYRFERGLHDAQLQQYLLPLRRLFPLRETRNDDDSREAQESIAARDVIDGIKLIDAWRDKGSRVLTRITSPRPNPADRAMLEQQIEIVDQALDAVGDIMVSESVFQSVRGNYERGAAALSALDRQGRPPDPEVIRTPRTGHQFQHRLIIGLQPGRRDTNWDGISNDVRSRAEPRLDAWLAAMIGDPQRFSLGALVSTDTDLLESVSVNLHEFMRVENLSPLSLVLTSVAASAHSPSQFELTLAQHLASQVSQPAEGATLELLDDAETDNVIGLGALQSLLKLLHRLVSSARVADARDFLVADADLPSQFDHDELQQRIDTVHAQLQAALTAIGQAIADPRAGNLRQALKLANQLGIPDALADALANDETAIAVLLEQAEAVERTLQARSDAFDQAQAHFNELSESRRPPLHEHQITSMRALLGSSFPVFPAFMIANGDEAGASLADRDALLDGTDEQQVTGWLHQMARVRPQVEQLSAVLTAADMLDAPLAADQYRIIQLPHLPGQRWAGAHVPDADTSPELSIVLLGQIDITKRLAGIVVDGWSEKIPSQTEITGLSFHFDAPAARAPQSIVLAVPPDLTMETWSFDAVRQSILETYRQARLRAVGPKELLVLGGSLLPMIYLPDDRTRQHPTINFDQLARQWATLDNRILGKRHRDIF